MCGLKWSPDDREVASGGNDNQLYIWNLNSTSPIIKFSDHNAAVKAIAWSPHQHGLLASGGGTADRCIRFWNSATNTALNCIDTGKASSSTVLTSAQTSSAPSCIELCYCRRCYAMHSDAHSSIRQQLWPHASWCFRLHVTLLMLACTGRQSAELQANAIHLRIGNEALYCITHLQSLLMGHYILCCR